MCLYADNVGSGREWYVGDYEPRAIDAEVAEEDAGIAAELAAVLNDPSATLADRRSAADRSGFLHAGAMNSLSPL